MSDEVRGRRERWQRIEQIYCETLEQDHRGRRALLDEACAGDAALRREVESLMACEADAAGFIESPALQVAADMWTRRADADLVGRRLGPYVVEAWVGSGGMGDVYRARDGNLQRDVALKILPDLFAIDPDRLARFKREAQVLASLNHPNIAAIHGFEESNGLQALVLELVDGPTLADRIAQGAIPIDEVLPIARQIAEGLEAAHERGIVHRDLKPSNIAVRTDGTVKLLDFGIATALQPEASVRAADTVTPPPDAAAPVPLLPATGTAAYASPEQVRGRLTDKRIDVWAFGAVVFEMLTGQVAFPGQTTPDIMVAVLQHDIDWALLPNAVPPAVRGLLQRCLERDVSRRLRDIGEARIVLEPLVGRPGTEIPVALPAAGPLLPRAVLLAFAAALMGSAFAGAWLMRERAVSAGVTRFSFTLPDGQSVALPASRHAIALSPDGTRLAYVAGGRLYLRRMAELDAHQVRGTEGHEGLTEPVFSPDGRSIAFWTPVDRTIKRIGIDGGSAMVIAPADDPYGMRWTTDGIVFGQGRNGIMRSASPGALETLVRVAPHEQAHSPQLLPGGRHVLFTLAAGDAWERWERANVFAQSLASGERTLLIDGASDAQYLPTGHLVYVSGGTLFAVAFDAERLEVHGTAVPLIEGIRRGSGRETGAAQFAVSQNGTLAFVPGPLVGPEWGPQQLVLADRTGSFKPLNLPTAAYRSISAAPDGKRIALAIDDGKQTDIFTYSLSGSQPLQRLTLDGDNRFPVWSSDGRYIAFQSNRDGDLAVFRQLADGGATAERLTAPAASESHAPESWSPDDRVLLFSVSVGTDVALRALSLDDRRTVPFGDVRSRMPLGARFSPDGRWVVYVRAERDGPPSIYVEPFPPTGVRYQLPVKGAAVVAHKPVWSPDGHELLYIPRLGGFEATPVTTRPGLAFGSAVTLSRAFNPGAPNVRAIYDILPQGTFVGVIPVGDSNPIYAAPSIQLVLNWFEELRTRVPTAR